MKLEIEDIIAIQKYYNVCTALHELASVLGAPQSLEKKYNEWLRIRSTPLPTHTRLTLQGILMDASEHPDEVEHVILTLKNVAEDLSSYLR